MPTSKDYKQHEYPDIPVRARENGGPEFLSSYLSWRKAGVDSRTFMKAPGRFALHAQPCSVTRHDNGKVSIRKYTPAHGVYGNVHECERYSQKQFRLAKKAADKRWVELARAVMERRDLTVRGIAYDRGQLNIYPEQFADLDTGTVDLDVKTVTFSLRDLIIIRLAASLLGLPVAWHTQAPIVHVSGIMLGLDETQLVTLVKTVEGS